MTSKSKAKILVVDDNPEIIEQIQQFLVDSDYEVFVAKSGEKALQRLQITIPDLILMDIIMPGIDGYETSARIKSNKDSADVPIIFMSALHESFDKVKAFKTGAVDYITKPLNNDELLVRIKTHLSISQLQNKLKEANSQLEEKVRQRTFELQESEVKYRKLFENLQEGIWVIDKKNISTMINPALTKMLGYKAKSMIGKSFLDFLDDKGKDIVSTYFNQIKSGLSKNIDIELIRSDGQKIFTSLEASQLLNENGEFDGIILGLIDITQRKQAENNLLGKNKEYELLNEELKEMNLELKISKEKASERETQLRAIANNLVNGMIYQIVTIGESERKFTYLSNKVQEFYGCSIEDAIADSNLVYGKIHPDDIQDLIDKENFSLKHMSIFKTEARILKPDGSIRWSLFISRPRKFNEALFWDGLEIDISEQKKNAQDLEHAKEKAEISAKLLQQVTDNIPAYVAVVDAKSLKYKFVNKQFTLGFNKSKEEIIDHHIVDIIGQSNTDFAMKFINNVRKGKSTSYVNSFNTAEGKRHVNVNYVPGFDENGMVKDILVLSHDVTAIKETEEELIKSKEMAEENDTLKTAFLQNMSHEIRTPLNAIIGFSNLLNNSDISDEKRNNFTSIIINSGNQLLSIVTDILTISSLETKQEKVNIQKVPINNIIVDLLAIFRSQASNNKIALFSKQELSDIQSEVYTDKTKINQILSNLIANALKFTQQGFVEFGYELIPGETDFETPEGKMHTSSFMKFYVKDSGIGISPDHQEKIFERFRQADMSINKKFGGTGLGLSISKGFVEMLGGKIWVESVPEKGSTFYFTIPYLPVNNRNSDEFQMNKVDQSITILIAEDEEYNYLYLQELLKEYGVKTIHTKDGKETVEICKSNPDIGLILMDIKMPILDGYQAAKIIKKFRPDLPIIAQSAYALVHEKEKYSGNAFNDYITKPIERKVLMDSLGKFIKI
jgi:PAS domain S-box-containing protein